MKYELVAGEASGDLHASHLISSLKKVDPDAKFRFFGGDNMRAAAGEDGVMVRHYRDLAYMGFIPVLLHLRTIMQGMKQCQQDIMQWQPDVVIFVDYAGFNLKVAKYLRQQRDKGLWHGSLYYYIAPKIWAWKEYRIKNFQRDIDEMFSILPFEKAFFEEKHHYPIHYVGNPTADEVRQFIDNASQDGSNASSTIAPDGSNAPSTIVQDAPKKPTIALLAGSRRQEIKDNLPAMIEAALPFSGDYNLVIAGAPGIEQEYYDAFIKGQDGVTLQPFNAMADAGNGYRGSSTYVLLNNAVAALVTSGTATLETACFRVPQVVCYKTPLPKLFRWAFNHIIKCRYISLVNLIADKDVVQELFADRFSVKNIHEALADILPGNPGRERMLADYEIVHRRLADSCAPDNAARIMKQLLSANLSSLRGE